MSVFQDSIKIYLPYPCGWLSPDGTYYPNRVNGESLYHTQNAKRILPDNFKNSMFDYEYESVARDTASIYYIMYTLGYAHVAGWVESSEALIDFDGLVYTRAQSEFIKTLKELSDFYKSESNCTFNINKRINTPYLRSQLINFDKVGSFFVDYFEKESVTTSTVTTSTVTTTNTVKTAESIVTSTVTTTNTRLTRRVMLGGRVNRGRFVTYYVNEDGTLGHAVTDVNNNQSNNDAAIESVNRMMAFMNRPVTRR